MNDDRLIWLSDALDAIYKWVGVTEKDLDGVLALRIYSDLLNIPAADVRENVKADGQIE